MRKTVLGLCFTLFSVLTASCGQTPAVSTAATLGMPSVQTSYRYENASPVIVNGRPVLAHRYWSCIDDVRVTFPEAMRLGTVLGNVYVSASGNRRGGLSLVSVDASYRQFVFHANASYCNDYAPMQDISVGAGVWSVSGLRTSGENQPLTMPAGRDAGVAGALPGPGLHGRLTVSPQQLNVAMAALQAFPAREQSNPLYQGGLKLMPLEFLLTPFSPNNRERQYGAPDTLYALRRAARFVQALYPNLAKIPVADLSESDGSTPHSGDIVLHPDGAHTGGKDVDVAYVTTGSGNDPGAAFDMEKNFWLLYGLLDSTSVDLVITAYKADFMAMAQAAYGQGLINAHAVGRFGALMEDTALNHDKHMHVAVSNLLNDGRTRRFTPADDVYSCYLGLNATSTDGADNDCTP